MTLSVYRDVEQGSGEWLDLRRGMVTASEMGGLITPKTIKVAANMESRALAARLVAERITGYTDPGFVSDDMARGWDDEPRARDLYAETWTPVETAGFMVRSITTGAGDDEREVQIGYSPDGLVPNVNGRDGSDGLIEVKSRRPDKHLQTILNDTVPVEYMPQIQTGLLVSGREWCDFISYSGGMPMWVRRVYPDPAWHAAIVEAVVELETAAVEMVATYRAAIVGLPMTERVEYEDLVI